MMYLSPHFTLAELTRTSHTTIANAPSLVDVLNLVQLCIFILEPARAEFGKPIIITSGFRSKELNAAVGGVPNSNHLFGRAADIRISSRADGQRLFAIMAKNPKIDELFWEHSKNSQWLHVAWSSQPRHKINSRIFL